MANAAATDIPESAYQLGALVEDFRISRVELAFNIICVPGVLGFLAVILWCRAPNLFAPRDTTELAWTAGRLGMTLVSGGWAIWMTTWAYHNRHMRVLIFEQGFVSFRPDKVFTCRWTDVAWTREQMKQTPMATIRELTVHLHTGEEWQLSKATDLVRDFDRLIEMVERKVAEVHVGGCLDELRAGKALEFGVLKLSRDGVSSGDRVLGWPEVRSIDEERGHRITIEKQGAWLTWAAIGVTQIVNKRLFLDLAERLGAKVKWNVGNA
jgi:hypothetical protein